MHGTLNFISFYKNQGRSESSYSLLYYGACENCHSLLIKKKCHNLLPNYHLNLEAHLKCKYETFPPYIFQVLQATVMKQLEIAESIEEVIRRQLRVKLVAPSVSSSNMDWRIICIFHLTVFLH